MLHIPSPNDQFHDIGDPVEVSLNWTGKDL